MKNEKRSQSEKQKRCPFDSTLKCLDCRLFETLIGSGGKGECVFKIILRRLMKGMKRKRKMITL